MTRTNLTVLALAGLALQGCVAGGLAPVTPQPPSAQTQAATLLAALNGGLVSGVLGEGLSDNAKLKAVAAEYRALENPFGAEPARWSDDRSGAVGEVAAAVPYRVGSQDCRTYTHTVTFKGQARSATGAACRRADGAWLRLE